MPLTVLMNEVPPLSFSVDYSLAQSLISRCEKNSDGSISIGEISRSLQIARQRSFIIRPDMGFAVG